MENCDKLLNFGSSAFDLGIALIVLFANTFCLV
nr:MAG TPA: hypothetical protein [Caudoviricetes sp.]